MPAAVLRESAPSPGLQLVRQVAGAAQAACLGGPAAAALTWQHLLDWPAWALADNDTDADALALRCAALWQAEALHQCIDGPTLQEAARLLGVPGLQASLASHWPWGGAAVLPPATQLAARWQALGRAILLGSVAPGPLRDAVAAAQHRRCGWAATIDLPPDDWPCQALVEQAREWLDRDESPAPAGPAQAPEAP